MIGVWRVRKLPATLFLLFDYYYYCNFLLGTLVKGTCNGQPNYALLKKHNNHNFSGNVPMNVEKNNKETHVMNGSFSCSD